MTRLFLIIIMVTQLGCAELTGYTIGTTSAENSSALKDLQETKP